VETKGEAKATGGQGKALDKHGRPLRAGDAVLLRCLVGRTSGARSPYVELALCEKPGEASVDLVWVEPHQCEREARACPPAQEAAGKLLSALGRLLSGFALEGDGRDVCRWRGTVADVHAAQAAVAEAQAATAATVAHIRRKARPGEGNPT
jgi:hypothetical protein